MNNLSKNSKDETYVKVQLTQCRQQKKSGTQKLENLKGVLGAQQMAIRW
jgi:hypothetical protein